MSRPLEDLTASHHRIASVLPRLDRALDVMHGHLGGYPATASGGDHGDGSPTLTHDGERDVELTRPERVMAAAERRGEEGAARYRRALRIVAELERLTVELQAITDEVAPDAGPTKPKAGDAIGAVPAGCCTSCFRDGGVQWPVAQRYNGSKLCRWCGDFRAKNGQLPHLALVRLRHEGKNITPAIAARYLRDDVTSRPRSTKRKPSKKEQRAARLARVDRQAKRLREGL